jgi:hypothetical protein
MSVIVQIVQQITISTPFHFTLMRQLRDLLRWVPADPVGRLFVDTGCKRNDGADG